MLGSDRGEACVDGVVRCLAERFGVPHVLGKTYNPRAQSSVERPHREYNMFCKALINKVRGWDMVALIFQWTVTTSARIYNSHYFSPYEIIAGMKPCSPLDYLASGSSL